MEEGSICAPLLAESDTENNIISTHNVASVSDADTVINTNNTNSSQIEGSLLFRTFSEHSKMLKEHFLFPADLGESDLLKGLFTDSHCHVCEASLLFESQRIAHYEGKKHAQKVRLYVQTKKDEKRSKDFQRGITMDKDRFCELCSMVFSSPVVARSHYDGKVHAKNLRKQALYPTTQPADTLSQRVPGLAIPGPLQVSGIDQGMGEEGGKGPQNTSETVDLSDPNKHCRLCAASFNNPHMAQQHYAGRKHQRNHSRQQLLKDLGEDPAQANSFTCPVCNIKLDSVEMYHAHMQGNKHQIKEKKVVDLCKSQKKVYDSFADELADYIHVQKARGIAPKTSFGATEEEGEGGANLGKVDGQNKTTLGLPPSSCPPLPLTSLPLHPTAAFYPPPLWCPPYQAPPTHFGFKGGTYEQTAWGNTFPQPFIPGSAPAGFIGWPKARGRGKECSSSSSSCTSSSSSYSSSSDSSDSDYRHRERKRRKRKMRKERERRAREEDSEERKRRRRGKSLREDDTEGRRGREHDEEAEEDSRRKRKRLHYSSRSHREGHRAKKRREEDEEKEGRKEEKEESTEERVGGGEEKEVHIQAEIQEEMDDREQAKETKAKHRKDKKKTKEKVDTRTEEEKLWDESIIGL